MEFRVSEALDGEPVRASRLSLKGSLEAQRVFLRFFSGFRVVEGVDRVWAFRWAGS